MTSDRRENRNLKIILDTLTANSVQAVQTESMRSLHENLIVAAVKWTGKGMNVIKVADTFMLGNGSPGPSYSLTSFLHSMEYILIPPCTMT